MNRSPSERAASDDPFTLLGLPRSFEIESDVLEARYLALAEEVHPDRFVGGTLAEQRAARERSARVNEAYRVLREPVRRAEALVKLGGLDLDSSDRERGAPAMGQAFLVEMIERRETVAEARALGWAALEDVRARTEAELGEHLDRAVRALANGDVAAAARVLVARRYLQRIVDEIDAAADGEGTP